MNILITGSKGLVGSACMKLFSEKGHNVFGIDTNQRSRMFGTESKPIYADTDYNEQDTDIRDMIAIEDLFAGTKWDAVIHTAAQPSHDYATDHVLEDFHINATGTVNLLEGLRHTNPEGIFVYVSTDKVYGENMSGELRELETRYDLITPASGEGYFSYGFDESLGLDFAGDRSFFGCSKAAADMYVQQYAARGLITGTFRPGCITGRNHAGAPQHGFLAYLAKCIKEEKLYTIYGNGKTVRDQVHASDFARAILAFVDAPRIAAVYNFGGGPERAISVLEAIAFLEKETGKKAQIEYGPERLGDRRWDVHDISKFRKDYPDWDYQYSLQDIINDLVN